MEAARQSPYSGLLKGVANGHGGTSPGYFLGPTLQMSQHPEESWEADTIWSGPAARATGNRAAALDAGKAGSVFNLRGLVPVVNPRTTFRVGSFI